MLGEASIFFSGYRISTGKSAARERTQRAIHSDATAVNELAKLGNGLGAWTDLPGRENGADKGSRLPQTAEEGCRAHIVQRSGGVRRLARVCRGQSQSKR